MILLRPTRCRRLWVVRQELPRVPLMALTATASERVQQDIVQQLRLRQPLMLRASFDRPNISLQGGWQMEAQFGPCRAGRAGRGWRAGS